MLRWHPALGGDQTDHRGLVRAATAHVLDRSRRDRAVDRSAQLPQPAVDIGIMSLDHTKLDVYHRALDLLDLLDHLIDELPPGRAHLKDQLDRAGTSVVLNIAEGAGEFSLPDKQRFYRMANRSATETSAIIAILDRR